MAPGNHARQKPRISVLMSVLAPNPDFLRAAVESVLTQTEADLELIVLEDPSDQPAAPVLAEFADDRLRHEQNPKRVSLAESRGQTLELARADLVAIMDADDIADPNRLRRQCDFLDQHTEVDVVGSQIAVMAADGTQKGYRHYPLAHDEIVVAMRRYNPLAHPTIAMRKAAELSTGGYTELAGGTCEDYGLWSRMAQRGHGFANLPEALLRYRLHAGSHKSRLLRQTLRDTIWIKHQYWRPQFDLGDQLRLLGERALGCLPAPLVSALFQRMTLQPELRTAGNSTGAAG